jgi:hypothetical protein
LLVEVFNGDEGGVQWLKQTFWQGGNSILRSFSISEKKLIPTRRISYPGGGFILEEDFLFDPKNISLFGKVGTILQAVLPRT